MPEWSTEREDRRMMRLRKGAHEHRGEGPEGSTDGSVVIRLIETGGLASAAGQGCFIVGHTPRHSSPKSSYGPKGKHHGLRPPPYTTSRVPAPSPDCMPPSCMCSYFAHTQEQHRLTREVRRSGEV
eukprot:TRINITY_DN164_c0_g1_i3.p3 TRINITY_DN164_c0_g1~~TRINITY_DN164_c0_g1_i3.p3  ORF type:complete len:126 (-),score=1.92 TRINITY_DN164_c0_g1_i3:561-938(-)